MANPYLKNESVRHWLLSTSVLGALVAVVAGQTYFERMQEPYQAPPILNADKSNAPGVLQRAARVAAVAHAYNRASDAVRTSNRTALAEAIADLRQLKAASRVEPLALSAAEDIVSEAGMLDGQAQNLKGAEAIALQTRAALKYREAQRLSPRFNSRDPYLLNALGYFLAERGSTPVDFREAERLTRRSLEIWAARIKATEERDAALASYMFSRANTRDSLAWALHRQGRFEEALQEQQQSIIEATVSSKALSVPQPVPAELHFHLGEIYRALKRWNEAREQYQKALELKPDDTASQQALKQLAKQDKGIADKSGKERGRSAPKPFRLPTPAPNVPEPDEPEPEVPVVPESNPLIAQL